MEKHKVHFASFFFRCNNSHANALQRYFIRTVQRSYLGNRKVRKNGERRRRRETQRVRLAPYSVAVGVSEKYRSHVQRMLEINDPNTLTLISGKFFCNYSSCWIIYPRQTILSTFLKYLLSVRLPALNNTLSALCRRCATNFRYFLTISCKDWRKF